MKKRVPLLLLLLYAVIMTTGAQNSPATAPCKDSLHVFRFVAASDMFYIPYKGNDRELARLTKMIEAYRDDILARRIPIFVNGWCTSQPDRETNLRTAATRSNRVKSELILRATLKEDCFVTHNHADAYEGQKDIVTVVLRIPVKETVSVQPKDTATEAETREAATPEASEKEPGKQPEAQQKPQEAVSELPVALPTPETYCVAVRTNLLYDAMLLPTIGVEWRVSPDWGIKLDGSLAWWGGSKDKVQKIWLLNPEVRRYLLRNRRFYVGASGSYGEYNIYKYPLGSLFSKDTGYQGSVWNAGLTVGYQLYLSRHFSVDFNLGLGYTRSEYDSYGMTDGVRVYKAKDQSKNFWGPTQAGISLVWTIGSNQ